MKKENIYELLYMSRQGSEYALEALFNHSMRVVRNVTRASISCDTMYLSYYEDIVQELSPMIFEAAETYREDQNAQFETYLSAIIRKRVWRCCKAIRRHEQHFGQMVSLDAITPEGDPYHELISQKNPMNDPVYAMEYRDASKALEDILHSLSPLELDAVAAWMMSETYRDGAQRHNLPLKTWDGRRSRATKKVKQAIKERWSV